MKRSGSSHRWLHEHVSDPFVQRARIAGYRSRAAYKLLAIDNAERFLRPGSVIVDLGASPGGWSQVAVERLKGRGRIFAVDLLPFAPLPGVMFLEGDFCDGRLRQRLADQLADTRVDVVLSDMSPNLSGISLRDQARSVHLAELALAFARSWLKPGGVFLVKTFQGSDFDNYQRTMQQIFQTVVSRKPDASRNRSPERYLLGRALKTESPATNRS